MIYLLDTNTCIGYINRRNPSIYQHFLSVSPDDVCICDVVKFELYYGAYKGSRSIENLQILANFFADLTSLPFEAKAAQICGQIRAKLQAKGTPIGDKLQRSLYQTISPLSPITLESLNELKT